MSNIPSQCCFVIPPHILERVAELPDGADHLDARSTLDHMHQLVRQRKLVTRGLTLPAAGNPSTRKRLHVYDAKESFRLPGTLVFSPGRTKGGDPAAREALEGASRTYDFFWSVYGRRSLDGFGARIDSSVHYGRQFVNAMWNGRHVVYGDGDGRWFKRFTASLDVVAHELTHGVTQHTAALSYSGQSGALNEHLSDVFGILVKQHALGLLARQSDWLIGADLAGPEFRGKAIRSMADPGTAYDDPLLGRDPQPAHMRDYVDTVEDNGGVHINSGIPNRAFHLAALTIGGHAWEVPGSIWYAVLTSRLTPDATFLDFAQATVDVAGEMYDSHGSVQRAVVNAWKEVGIRVPIVSGRRLLPQAAPQIVPKPVPSGPAKWCRLPVR